MQYDAKGRLVLASDPRRSMKLDYDNDYMSALTFSDGTMYSYKYSAAGDLLQVAMNGDVLEEYEYDARHKLIHVVKPKEPSLERTIAYDDAGLRRSVAMPDHTESRWAFTETDDKSIVERTLLEQVSLDTIATEKFIFDVGDNSLEMDSVDGEVKIYHLTICLCFPLDVQTFELTAEPGKAPHRVLPGKMTAYKYDPFGRLILRNEHGNMTRYTYDDRSNKVSEVETSTDGAKWTTKAKYSYNDQANLSAIDTRKKHITLEYDEFERISSLQHNDIRLTFTYNRRDKPIAIALDGGGSVSFTYKENGDDVDKIDSHGGTGNSASKVMEALQDLIDAAEPARARFDTDYSHVESVDGDRRCSCTLE
jgi:YD repeat-containing protein